MGFGGLLKLIADKFAELHIRYAVIGGLALHAAGYNRSTGDVDLLVHADDIDRVKTILLPAGYSILHESENILNLASPWQMVGGVDVIKAQRHYTLAMLERARPYDVLKDVRLPIVRPEDVIGLKVQAFCNDPARRARDLADIEWLIRYQKIDMALIQEYFNVFSMQDELALIVKKVRDAQ
ncbi:MAG: nucleotidyltransferase family protein [Candidatus Omnitrophica bacterium]|nr:nucleotidyltransferase family protein [Candidatus Omnitrophota bacterium]